MGGAWSRRRGRKAGLRKQGRSVREKMPKGLGEPCPNAQKRARVCLPADLSSIPQATVCLLHQRAQGEGQCVCGGVGLVPSSGSEHAPIYVCVKECKVRIVPV